jgi:hypothetical protein
VSKSQFEYNNTVADRDLYSGLIRLHVLHHAVEGPIFGLGMIEELARHGYRISPGSLYPLLQGLEKKGIFSQKRNATANRCGACIGRRGWAGKPWRHRKAG